MQVPARTYTHIQLVRNHYSRNHRERNMSLGSCSGCHHHISVTGLLTHKRAHTHTHTHATDPQAKPLITPRLMETGWIPNSANARLFTTWVRACPRAGILAVILQTDGWFIHRIMLHRFPALYLK